MSNKKQRKELLKIMKDKLNATSILGYRKKMKKSTVGREWKYLDLGNDRSVNELYDNGRCLSCNTKHLRKYRNDGRLNHIYKCYYEVYEFKMGKGIF